jgi:hypothetical protein
MKMAVPVSDCAARELTTAVAQQQGRVQQQMPKQMQQQQGAAHAAGTVGRAELAQPARPGCRAGKTTFRQNKVRAWIAPNAPSSSSSLRNGECWMSCEAERRGRPR